MTITIIGIDCAVDEKNMGVTLGNYSDGICTVFQLYDHSNFGSVSAFVRDCIRRFPKTLLALDAPLGWPSALGMALSEHMAGAGIGVQSEFLFRRATDRFVKKRFGKQPLDVGADRIARTALSALQLLEELRQTTALEIPIIWSPIYTEKAAAIEVYPAGSLVSYGLPSSGYKKAEQIPIRQQILQGLRGLARFDTDLTLAETNADVLDSIACVLAGRDFLAGHALPPDDLGVAKKEGWIWIGET